MNPRKQYIDYFEDLARRNVDIAHDPTSRASRRFFLELDYEKLMGWEAPNNTGWNLVLMGYETAGWDNRHGRKVEKVSCVFDVLKHAKNGDPELLQGIYDQAREIGEELLVRFDEHTNNPCDAVLSAGVEVPYAVDFQGKQAIEVGPRWDNFFGYRFSLTVLQDKYVKRTSTPSRWRTL